MFCWNLFQLSEGGIGISRQAYLKNTTYHTKVSRPSEFEVFIAFIHLFIAIGVKLNCVYETG